jgi:hypothetical protein
MVSNKVLDGEDRVKGINAKISTSTSRTYASVKKYCIGRTGFERKYEIYNLEILTPLGAYPTILSPKVFNNCFKNEKIDSEERSGCHNGIRYPALN